MQRLLVAFIAFGVVLRLAGAQTISAENDKSVLLSLETVWNQAEVARDVPKTMAAT